jgi:hypothetical protein
MREEFPVGFIWTCCGRRGGESLGCTRGRHDDGQSARLCYTLTPYLAAQPAQTHYHPAPPQAVPLSRTHYQSTSSLREDDVEAESYEIEYESEDEDDEEESEDDYY